jgi:alpha-tubulin suppressor-like RCC1 family protein
LVSATENIALGKPAIQSSTAWGAEASLAVDGNTSGNYYDGTVTHTWVENPAWWEVNLLNQFLIDKIVIWNRTDCCPERLSGFRVYIDNALVYTHPNTTPGTETIIPVNGKMGQQVRIEIDNNYLSLAEVQVFGRENVALGKPATQSSTHAGGEASRAVDGNTSGNWPDGSVTHTSSDKPAWWEVNLLNQFLIDKIVVWNRTDCCPERLSGFRVYVDNALVYTHPDTTPESKTIIPLDGKMGQRVRIEITDNYLSLAEVQVFGREDIKWMAIAASSWLHSIALKSDGTLWAWGDNSSGQLGDGTFTNRSTPVRVGTDTNWVAITAGYYRHNLALKSDGTLWAWGDNWDGQLGDGTTADRTTPVRVGTDTNWTAITAGWEYTIALKSDGTLWAWGDNYSGQLGDGTTVNRTTPVRVGTDTNWVAIEAGGVHTVALKSDGTLWAWGDNYFGQLGDGTTITRTTPVQIGTDTKWVAISAGWDDTIALKSDGTLWAWGFNDCGQLGDGSTTNRTTPVQIGTDTKWKAIAAGGYHTIALKSDGTLWAWGGNWDGQLGNGSTPNLTTPVQIGTDTKWSAIAAGGWHTMALKSDGTLWTWGDNEDGQLGDGTTTNRTTPVQIMTDTK